jgi:hypothetical protein
VVLSAITLAADSIVPAMIVHFVNNSCLILLARAASGDVTERLSTGSRVGLIALAGSVVAVGLALIVRGRPPRRVM